MKKLLLLPLLALSGCSLDYGARHHLSGDIAVQLKLWTPEEPLKVRDAGPEDLAAINRAVAEMDAAVR